MNRVRARTSSRSPGLRLLLVGIAMSLVNIWVYLKWAYLGLAQAWRTGGVGRVVPIDYVQAVLARRDQGDLWRCMLRLIAERWNCDGLDITFLKY